MTLKELRSYLWYLARKETGNLIGGDISLGIWHKALNDGQAELIKTGIVRNRRAYCTTVANQIDYQLPSYCKDILMVEVYDTDNTRYVAIPGTSLELLAKYNQDWRDDDSQDHPSEWVRLGEDWFMVHPAFDAAVTDGIRIYYTRWGDTLSGDSDVSKIPADYHINIVYQAYINMFPLAKDAQYYQMKLNEALMEMKAYSHKIDQARYRIQRKGR